MNRVRVGGDSQRNDWERAKQVEGLLRNLASGFPNVKNIAGFTSTPDGPFSIAFGFSGIRYNSYCLQYSPKHGSLDLYPAHLSYSLTQSSLVPAPDEVVAAITKRFPNAIHEERKVHPEGNAVNHSWKGIAEAELESSKAELPPTMGTAQDKKKQTE